jgi:hypothetical protein
VTIGAGARCGTQSAPHAFSHSLPDSSRAALHLVEQLVASSKLSTHRRKRKLGWSQRRKTTWQSGVHP